MVNKSIIQEVLTSNQGRLLDEWEKTQRASIRMDLIKPAEFKAHMREFYEHFLLAAKSDNFEDMDSNEWTRIKEFLSSLSYSRGIQGYTPTETVMFVFSLKKCLLLVLREKMGTNAATSDEIWMVGEMLDKLGLFTTEVYQKAREDVINRQQFDMLELSTPVVELSTGIIALPMIGTLDSSRTSVVMETLLKRIVETSAVIAIIDITGVPTVDTLVAQHLLKTVTAARLMGAECIISGIRPQIAATIVHLGVDLGNVVTKSTLASAFKLALKRTGQSIIQSGPVVAGV